MRALLTASLGLFLACWVSALQGQEAEWRPAKSSTPQTSPVSASSNSPAAFLGRPMAAGALGVSAAADRNVCPPDRNVFPPYGNVCLPAMLARPVAASSQAEATPIFDPNVIPASLASVPPSPAVVRAQAEEPQRMPLGKPQADGTALETTEDLYNQGIVTKQPKSKRVFAVTANKKSGPAGPIQESPGVESGPPPGAGDGVSADFGCGDGGVCCDDGVCCEDPCAIAQVEGEHSLFWVRAEYLLWIIKPSEVPPLLTTSPPASLGILGNAGTSVVFGGHIDNEERSGGRFTLGFWLDPDEDYGIEGSFFFLHKRTVNFGAGQLGQESPLLARPFLDAATGRQNAEQVANPPIAALPGVLPLTGGVRITLSSALWGAEANGIINCCKGDLADRLDFLFGFRYMQLNERLAITENLLVPPGAPLFAGSTIFVTDRFNTRNEFFGEQLGFRCQWHAGRRWQFDLTGKVAIGLTHEVVDISGGTVITPAGGPATAFSGGLLAQPTNIGRYSRDQFAVVPEVGINVSYWLTDHWRILVGYNFLYWSNVVRPGDQIDTSVNSSQIAPGVLVGPARPAFSFKDTDFWAQGVNFGLELTY